ncbi:nucleotide-diphospho-sugar transferases superfamily protein [Actinidia rufa]|uniref:Nucleotide-diphospho-sugar transferases superfamily protein n=1 Tax=Actinidia rufa TaxID=165716 RepID=A0A7J0DGJ3_9ERIC|nr:nucleotide-diphospho-sugar transferases superfamily protein [Actinidia rufa]
MDPTSFCAPSSSSGSSSSTKAWIVHGLVVGAAVAVALGAHAYLYLGRSGKFRSRVIGIIPARFASSRFPGKPLVQILGKPMIQAGFGSWIGVGIYGGKGKDKEID